MYTALSADTWMLALDTVALTKSRHIIPTVAVCQFSAVRAVICSHRTKQLRHKAAPVCQSHSKPALQIKGVMVHVMMMTGCSPGVVFTSLPSQQQILCVVGLIEPDTDVSRYKRWQMENFSVNTSQISNCSKTTVCITAREINTTLHHYNYFKEYMNTDTFTCECLHVCKVCGT